MNPAAPNSATLDLIDIIEPAAISSWPPAWGWWVLMIATACVIGLIAYVSVVMLKQQKIKTLALGLLNNAKCEYEQSGNANNYCRDINQILKRYWLYYRPGSDINALNGKLWVEQLNMQCDIALFTSVNAIALSEGPYSQLENFDANALENAAKQWIKRASINQLKDTSGGVNV